MPSFIKKAPTFAMCGLCCEVDHSKSALALPSVGLLPRSCMTMIMYNHTANFNCTYTYTYILYFQFFIIITFCIKIMVKGISFTRIMIHLVLLCIFT